MRGQYFKALSVSMCALLSAAVLGSCSSDPSELSQPGPADHPPLASALPDLPNAGAVDPKAVSDSQQELAGDELFDHSAATVTVDSTLHTANFAPPAGQIGWTMQQFAIEGGDSVGAVGCTISGLDSGEKVYVFVSDYSTGRWKPLPPQENGNFTINLGSLKGVYSNGSSMYVAVISFGSTFTLEFTQVLVKTDFPGWFHNWGTTGSDGAEFVELDSDDSLLVGGELDGQALSGGEFLERRLAVLRFSPEGDIVKSRMFSWPSPDDELGPADCSLNAMLLAGDRSIYLVGNCVDGSFGSSRGLVMRLDEELAVEWAMLYGDAENRVELFAAEFDSLGNIVCVGTRRGDAHGVTDDAMQLVVDPDNGSLVADHVFTLGDLDFASQEQAFCMDLDPATDRVMMAGDVYVADGSTDQYILCTDTAGSVQWASSFGVALGFDSATAIVRGAGGSTVVTGTLEGLPGPFNNCTFLTISPLGDMAGLHSYTDSTAEGLFVRKLELNELGDGFLATGLRLDTETFVVAPTSIIPFSFDGILPGPGTDYGFFFDDWTLGDNVLYSVGFLTDDRQQSISGSSENFPAGSISEVIGLGAYFNLTVGSQDSGLTTEPFNAVESDVEGRLDGTLSEMDYDMLIAALDLQVTP